MPRESSGKFVPRSRILNFEEIFRICRVFTALGVTKLRITGGDPLLRKGLPQLIRLLSELDVDVALTTNGVLLPQHARALADAGLRRITVSLDALDDDVFQRMSDARGFAVRDVLRGIAAAEAAGFGSLKINTVVQRGVNESQVLPLARHFRGSGHTLRFIEYMDVGTINGWKQEQVVPRSEILSLLAPLGEMQTQPRERPGDVAQLEKLEVDGSVFGVIASVTEPFCGACSRARLSAEGSLVSCLFATKGLDLLSVVRGGSSDDQLTSQISQFWRGRSDRYSAARSEPPRLEHNGKRRLEMIQKPEHKVEMAYIGG